MKKAQRRIHLSRCKRWRMLSNSPMNTLTHMKNKIKRNKKKRFGRPLFPVTEASKFLQILYIFENCNYVATPSVPQAQKSHETRK